MRKLNTSTELDAAGSSLVDTTEDKTCPNCARAIYSLSKWIKTGVTGGSGNCPHCGAWLKVEITGRKYKLTYKYRW